MSDNITDITVHILHNIQASIAELRVEVASVRTDLTGEIGSLRTEVRSEITGLRDEMRGMRFDLCERIDRTSQRIDNLIEVAGGHDREQNQRITHLETRVDHLEKPKPRPRR